MPVSQSVLAALRSDHSYSNIDIHQAAYSGCRIEMTYRSGLVVVTIFECSLSTLTPPAEAVILPTPLWGNSSPMDSRGEEVRW